LLAKLKKWLKELGFMLAHPNPYSPASLRQRAAKLPYVPYRVLLELTAGQLDKKVISEDVAKKAVEYFRTGKLELLKVGVRMLNLSDDQTRKALILLKSGVIKDWKETTKE